MIENTILQEDLDIIANSDIDWERYQNKTVLVTGATGLIGSLLVRSFWNYNQKKGGKVSILAMVRNIEKAKKIFAGMEEDAIQYVIGDVVEQIHVEQQIDFIFHTASVTASKMMVSNPVETIETSYQGTNNILRLAYEKKAEGVVYVSSMEVYGRPDTSLSFVKEKDLGYVDLQNVRSSYPEGKRICECLCTAYAEEYQVPVKVARLAQTFGAGVLESDNRVYSQFAKSAMKQEDIVLHTEGTSEGNYCYSRDVIRALLMLGYKGECGEPYNVVNPESHMQIRQMASLVAEKVAKGTIKIIYDIPEDSKKYGYAPATKMHLSSEKLNELGWKAEVGMEEAYVRMIAYMKERGTNV